jgi:Raf kinase inhibitor-like YbhB/YbcL family protein
MRRIFIISFCLILLTITKGVFAMELTSSAFSDGGMLPAKYTCDGAGISPPISWTNMPANTKSFALIYDDPDAPHGTWTHWVLFNIPPTTLSLAEGVDSLPDGTQVGNNSWPKKNYGPPCPPSGEHRYIFHIFALDTTLNLKGTVTSEVLKKAMQGHILDTATLLGKHKKRK